MMRLMNMPIRRKLMVIILLTTAATLLLMRSLSFVQEFLLFRQTTLRQFSTVGQIVAANSTAALAFNNQSDAAEVLNALKIEQHISDAALYDKNGALFAKYPADAPESSFPAAPGGAGFRYEDLHLIGFQPVVQGDSELGWLYLRLDTGGMMRLWIRNSIGLALLAIVLAFIVAYLISNGLQNQISKPILELAETARAISERHDYSVRATKRGDDELGLLTEAFNQMLLQIQTLNRTLEHKVMERTAELETANKELEAFSYSVSHDLRAPLRAVDGFSQAVLEDFGEQLPDEGRRYLQTIRDGAQRMGTLIDDLLTFSRLSRLAVTKQTVDNDALVQQVLDELRDHRKGREVDLQVGALPPCQGDPALLKQVWINLLSNAFKYTRKQSATRIEVGAWREGDTNVYFVRDNGTGFDMRYADKLFGVFQRLHRADEFEGTGVGLAIVQRVVHRHGGRVWAQGEVDRGAEFRFSVGEGT